MEGNEQTDKQMNCCSHDRKTLGLFYDSEAALPPCLTCADLWVALRKMIARRINVSSVIPSINDDPKQQTVSARRRLRTAPLSGFMGQPLSAPTQSWTERCVHPKVPQPASQLLGLTLDQNTTCPSARTRRRTRCSGVTHQRLHAAARWHQGRSLRGFRSHSDGNVVILQVAPSSRCTMTKAATV